jgi:hypothetical protein
LEKTKVIQTRYRQNNTNLSMSKILRLLTTFFTLNNGVAISANKKSTPAIRSLQVKTDSSKINIRQFDSAAIKNYRNSHDFNYFTKKADVTWWDRFWAWVWGVWENFWGWVGDLLRKIFGNTNAGKNAGSVMEVIIIGSAVFLIVYLVLKLIGIDFLKFFKKNQSTTDVPYSEKLENIHQINFDESIENALAIKDYRLAVRLLYLRCLKQLSEANLINWKIEKSNSAYLNELKDETQRRKFQIVTRQFEYVWYGDFPVNGDIFRNINIAFQEFKEGLQ